MSTRQKVLPVDAKQALQNHEQKGYKVDDRVFKEIDAKGTIFSLKIEDKQTFYSFIWHEIDASRILTPKGQSRTLKDVVDRMIQNKYTFSKLATNLRNSPNEHNPNWFSGLEKIEQEFDYGKFGFIILTNATEEESEQSPEGSFYIYDGSHKSLVLAKKLKNGMEFKPIKCFLLLPRRN